jgi:hypothetical protein
MYSTEYIEESGVPKHGDTAGKPPEKVGVPHPVRVGHRSGTAGQAMAEA